MLFRRVKPIRVEQTLVDTILNRGVEEVVHQVHLEKRLRAGQLLRVKLGIDPTDPSLHLGHSVVLRKLRQFQQAGHQAVIIIGDWTAQIGDPTGRDKTRTALAYSDVRKNAQLYMEQIFRILEKSTTEIRWQSEWFKKFNLAKLFEILGKISVHELLSHETFQKRLKNRQPIAMHELMYPILQGYDSVMVKTDVELGAIEQKFNLLMGRTLQRIFGQPEQDVVMTPYLTGTDGKNKMSKSLGNTITLLDFPQDVYGKVMSIPDHLIPEYFTLCTDLTDKALKIIKEEVESGPRDAKARLAFLITETLFDEPTAERVQEEFNRVHRQKEIPTEMVTIHVRETVKIDDIMVAHRFATSRSEARRLINQKAVKVDGKTVENWQNPIKIRSGVILQVGKRKFAKLRLFSNIQ